MKRRVIPDKPTKKELYVIFKEIFNKNQFVSIKNQDYRETDNFTYIRKAKILAVYPHFLNLQTGCRKYTLNFVDFLIGKYKIDEIRNKELE